MSWFSQLDQNCLLTIVNLLDPKDAAHFAATCLYIRSFIITSKKCNQYWFRHVFPLLDIPSYRNPLCEHNRVFQLLVKDNITVEIPPMICLFGSNDLEHDNSCLSHPLKPEWEMEALSLIPVDWPKYIDYALEWLAVYITDRIKMMFAISNENNDGYQLGDVSFSESDFVKGWIRYQYFKHENLLFQCEENNHYKESRYHILENTCFNGLHPDLLNHYCVSKNYYALYWKHIQYIKKKT